MNFSFTKNIALSLLILFLSTSIYKAQKKTNKQKFKNCDIIFITNNTSPISKNKFAHVGFILLEDTLTYVYYANETIIKCGVAEFISQSKNKKYTLKHLIDKTQLNEEALNTIKVFVKAKFDNNKDAKLVLNTTDCCDADFIWKIYKTAIGISLCDKTEFKIEKDSKVISTQKIAVSLDVFESEYLEE